VSLYRDGEDIPSSRLDQASDGLYVEVPLRCASGPIARRWIVPTCVWKLSDCKNGSECWKIATRGPLSLLISCELSFPIVGLKISSLPAFALKSPNKMFMLYLRN
jgi:hypothetical protein